MFSEQVFISIFSLTAYCTEYRMETWRILQRSSHASIAFLCNSHSSSDRFTVRTTDRLKWTMEEKKKSDWGLNDWQRKLLLSLLGHDSNPIKIFGKACSASDGLWVRPLLCIEVLFSWFLLLPEKFLSVPLFLCLKWGKRCLSALPAHSVWRVQ